MRSQDDKLRRMLDEVGRALVQAIHGSSEIDAAMRRIEGEGYKLHLLLGCLGEAPEDSAASSRESASRPTATPSPPKRKPSFRLSSDDVSFLKSVGIDPTRTVRRRKPRSLS